ncbi:hypothetical protein GQP80_001815 [Escherichia coli]|nr:hypothetical protein [Escherichia coli]
MSIADTWSDEEFIRQMNKMLNQHKEQEKDDDCNYQEKAAEWFWDAITERVKAEYAFAIFKRRHIYGEAA